jgi:hypothetical protein
MMFKILLAALDRGKITAKQYNNAIYKLYEGTTLAVTETLFTLNGFAFVVAKVLPEMRPIVEAMVDSDVKWGMSHGFLVAEHEDQTAHKIRTFELTVAQWELTANVFTGIDTLTNEDNNMKALTDQQREFLNSLVDGLGDNIENVSGERVARAREILDDVFQFKTVDEAAQDAEAVEEVVNDAEVTDETEAEVSNEVNGTYAEMRERMIADLNLEGLAEALQKMSEGIDSLVQRIGEIEQKQSTIEQKTADVDQQIADMFAPPVWAMPAAFRTSEAASDEETIEKLKQTPPQANTSNVAAGGLAETLAEGLYKYLPQIGGN